MKRVLTVQAGLKRDSYMTNRIKNLESNTSYEAKNR